VFSAFYRGCEHAIGEVTKGHRLCLVFKLMWDGDGPAPGLGGNDDETRLAKAISAMRGWDQDPEGTSKLIHILERTYTEGQVQYSGNDVMICQPRTAYSRSSKQLCG
jgi:hypothetical protein